MELGRASGSGSKKGFKPGLDIRVYDDDDLDRLEQVKQFKILDSTVMVGGKPPFHNETFPLLWPEKVLTSYSHTALLTNITNMSLGTGRYKL